MLVTEELLEEMELKIGHECKIESMPDRLGLRLIAMVKVPETGKLIFHERIFSFAKMHDVLDARILHDNFVLEAKRYFDHALSS